MFRLLTAEMLFICSVIKSTWKYIFEEWFPGSGYVYDEGKVNFEFYDERCHSWVDTVMEIYVPVKERAGK
ncbi:hypothetical protein AMQ84_10240 [Paenibacillus riograndensis]|uniref:GyrI-like small molecule binding domain-containing protein n=1 Tax=Paenibacillus riograndensis TaxID=483937 RepID=A0A132U425_9BACL|nr:hypothetical protein AMQ84_10240 [Paenibacillus riograndensis]